MKRTFLVILISLFMVSCSNEFGNDIKDLEGNYIQKIELDRNINELSTNDLFKYLKGKVEELQDGPEEVLMKTNSKVKTILGIDTDIYSASDICAVDDKLLVLDGYNSNLKVVTLDGKVTKVIGKLGSGNLEFKSPSAICYNKNLEKIYIYDAGNTRVVVLNKDFSFNKNIIIKFPKNLENINFANETHLSSIAVDDFENIYFLPIKANNKESARIMKFSGSELIEKYDGVAVGNLKLIDNRIFVIEFGEIFDFGETLFATSGKNRIFEIVNDKIVKIGTLPYKYRPEDIEIVGNKLFAYSPSWLTLDEFDFSNNLKHIRTLTPQLIPNIERDRGFGRHGSIAKIENKIAIRDRFTGNIYIVEID